MKKVLFLALCFSISGCVHKLDIVNFQTGQVLEGNYNELNRMVTVIMPDGEVLTGKYSAVNNASFSFGTASAFSGTAMATGLGYGISSGGQGQAYALLKSASSSLLMEMVVSYSEWTGHGFGEARTNDGRIFKVQF